MLAGGHPPWRGGSARALQTIVCAKSKSRIPIEHRVVFHYHPISIVFLLLLERPKSERTTIKKDQQEADLPDFSRIRCPLCKWQPKASHRWFCAPCDYPEYFDDGCGACWNTFTTRGRCPGCGHHWRWTACLNCEGRSLHEDWHKNEADKRQ